MSREKQLEEMAEILANGCKMGGCEECKYSECKFPECTLKYTADNLYNAGYHKASDVVRDIFNDLNEMWHKGRGFIKYSDLVRLERLHEQKYTESEKEVTEGEK